MSSPSRLPPGQQFAARGKWPLVGQRASLAPPPSWSLTVSGLVSTPRTWQLDELRALPVVECTSDIHCVTRWTKLDVTWVGVSLASLLRLCGPLPAARFVSFVAHSEHDHSSSLRLDDALQLGTLLAWQVDGLPLPAPHGGPLRSVTPGRYFYKSVKWVKRIELLAEDRLGYWEAEAGYHNVADPWLEQRYLAPRLTRQQAAQLIEARDFAGRDLLGVDAAGRDLTGLHAAGALLRNADFRDAQLQHANFQGANLSNAHFQRAVLREASLENADLEGANFEGADLTGAVLSGASLFGATFVPPAAANDGEPQGALIDRSTRVDESALEQLTDEQSAYVRRQLGQ